MRFLFLVFWCCDMGETITIRESICADLLKPNAGMRAEFGRGHTEDDRVLGVGVK